MPLSPEREGLGNCLSVCPFPPRILQAVMMDLGDQGFHVRVAEPADSAAVDASFRSSSAHHHDFSKLIEDSLYSFLGLSSDGEVLAFAAFDDAPYVPGAVSGKKAADIKSWAIDMSSNHGFRHDNSLWVESYVVNPSESHEEKYLKAFLSDFFKISPQTKAVLSLNTFEHGTGEILKPVCSSEEMQIFMSACLQSTVNPKFNIKLAVAKNYDDLFPIVENAQKKGALLSKIPDSAIPAQPYSLARLIAAQDKNNRVLIAEVDNKPVGMIVVTAALDPKILAHFQLDTYTGLIFAEHEKDGLCQSNNEKNQYSNMNGVNSHSDHGKDYCIVEVPYDVSAPYSLQYFSCVPTKEGVTERNTSLHILHRHSFTHEFKVHLAKSEDMQIIRDRIEGLEHSGSILDHLEHLSEGSVFLAISQKQPVGLAFVESECPTEALFSHFDLQRYVNVKRQNEGTHAVMTFFELSPLFWSHRRVFLREIMRQMGKTVIFVPVFSSHTFTNIIRDILFVPGRWHPSLPPSCLWSELATSSSSRQLVSQREGTQDPTNNASSMKFGQYSGFNCALFIMTHRLITRYRAIVNSRIVFVGASRTAASCIDRLISCANFKFTNLTLISPFGTKCLSSNEKMLIDVEQGPPESFHKSGIDHLVNVIVGTVVSFDRKEKIIHLANGENVRYDYLVLTMGLQDQTRSKLKIDRDRGFLTMDELLLMIEEKRIDVNATETESPIVIYGLTLKTFSTIQILISNGIPGHRLVLVYPELEPLESVAEKCFGDKDVSTIVVAGLIQAGIMIRSGLRLVGVNSGEAKGVLESIYLEDTQEHHSGEEDLQDQDRISYSLQGGNANHGTGSKGKSICQPCMLLVTCTAGHLDEDILQTIRKAGIVFNGRIVVDGNFQTNDRFILACGSAAKFSRNCGKGLNSMESYNSCELGMCLADAIVSLFQNYLPDQRDLSGGILPFPFERTQVTQSSRKNLLPRLIRAKGVGTLLPGDLVYFDLKCPTFNLDASGATDCIKPFVLKKHGCVLRINLGKFGQVGRIVYCGKEKLEAWKLIRVVGIYEPLIKGIVCSAADGISNRGDLFSQPWFRLVCHDKFHNLYDDLCKDALRIVRSCPRDEAMVKHVVSEGLLGFLDAYRSDFPELGIESPGRAKIQTAQQMPDRKSKPNVQLESATGGGEHNVERGGKADVYFKEVLHRVYNEIGARRAVETPPPPHVTLVLKGCDCDEEDDDAVVTLVFTVAASSDEGSGTDHVDVVCLVEGCDRGARVKAQLEPGDHHGHVHVALRAEAGDDEEIGPSAGGIRVRFQYLEEVQEVTVRILPRGGGDTGGVELEFGFVDRVAVTLLAR